MADIRFITGGELETNSRRIWTGTSLGSAPVSGITGAHGKVYDTASFDVSFDFPATQLVTGRARWRFLNNVDNEPFMIFWDEDTGVPQVSLIYRDDGSIEAVRQSTVLATSATGLFAINTWYEVEFRLRVSNGAGSLAVNRNGAQIICVPAGADTQTTSNAYTNTWSLGNSALGSYWDDCVLDLAGTYLGTGEVETLMPAGAGDVTQLAPSSIGVANYLLVDETPHDSDTTYVESTAADQVDTYSVADLSLSGTPLGAMLAVQARHTTGSPSLKLICRVDGENFETDDSFATLSSYGNHHFHCWSVNPATNEPWTEETLNAAQWGVRLSAAGMRVTQLGVMVYMRAVESAQCLASGASRDYCASVETDLN